MKLSETSLIRSICRESFQDFVKEFWETINADPLVWNWHMSFICDELQGAAERLFRRQECERDIIVNVPPGTSKSTICSQMFPAWLWTRRPETAILGASYSAMIAIQNSSKNRDIVRSEKYRRCFPEVLIRTDHDGKGYFGNTLKGTRFATGVSGTITGMHGDFLIVDDPLNPLQAASDAELRSTNEWISETLPSRKRNKSTAVTLLIMQRLHENDCTGYLLEQGNPINHICLPAECESNKVLPEQARERYVDGLLDPRRLNRSVLDKMKKNLGNFAYAGQFDQNPVPKVAGFCHPEKFVRVSSLPEAIEKQIRYWDKAGTLDGGCYTAGVKIAKLKDGSFIVLDVVRGQWEPFRRNSIIRQTTEADGHTCEVAIEEEGGSGGKESALVTVKELAGYRVTVDRPVGDKTLRAEPFVSQINAGNVYLMQGDWNRDFIDEFAMFPRSKYKDQVDAASAAFNLIFKKNKVDYKKMMGGRRNMVQKESLAKKQINGIYIPE